MSSISRSTKYVISFLILNGAIAWGVGQQRATPDSRPFPDYHFYIHASRLEPFYERALRDRHIDVLHPEELIVALRNRDPHVRMAAAYFLGKRQEHSALPALRQLLSDDDHHVRLDAAGELLSMGDPSGLDVVIEKSKSPNPLQREALLVLPLFAKFADKKFQILETLTPFLRDKQKDVRWLATRGLLVVGDPSVRSQLQGARARETDANLRMEMDEAIRLLTLPAYQR